MRRKAKLNCAGVNKPRFSVSASCQIYEYVSFFFKNDTSRISATNLAQHRGIESRSLEELDCHISSYHPEAVVVRFREQLPVDALLLRRQIKITVVCKVRALAETEGRHCQ